MLRLPDVITKQIQELDSIIESTKQSIQENYNHPHTKAMEFILEQDIEQKERLMIELQESLAYYRQHAIKLSFVTDLASMPIHIIGDVLSSFSIFLKGVNSIINGNERAIPLYLRNTFHGSFGLLLSTNPSDKLIEDTDKQMSVAFEAIMTVISDYENKNCLKEDIQKILKHDKKSLSRLKNLFEKFSKSEYAINIEWIDTYKNTKKVHIPYEKSISIYEMLSETYKDKDEDILLSGTVIAIDIKDLVFKILSNKDPYKIKMSKNDIGTIKNLLEKNHTFKVKKTIVFNEITEKEENQYELIS